MTTGVYTTKWFLQCFIERVSLPSGPPPTTNRFVPDQALSAFSPPPEPVHAHAAPLGRLHAGGGEDADRHGVCRLEAAQK